MTAFAFGALDIQAWSNYSGDTNPIHFDIQASRQLGVDGIIVHGMIAILKVREAIEAADSGTDFSTWTVSGIRLKNPVLQDEMVELSFHPAKGRQKFKLSSVRGDKLNGIRSIDEGPMHQGMHAKDALSWLPQRELDLGAGRIAGATADLKRIFPWIRSPWVATDALLFSEFIGRRVQETRSRALEYLASNGHVPAAADECTVVQTSHTTRFESRFWYSRDWECAGRVTAKTKQAEITLLDEGCAATLSWDVSHEDRQIMSTSIGLFLRINTRSEL